MLDPASPTPLYHQLARWLEAQVEGGSLRAGDRIESEPALARRFRIGRPTVRQATDVLVRRGLLERRQGAGTFVREARPRVDLFGLGGTLASFARGGVEMESRTLGPVTREEGALRLRRLHAFEGRPVVLEELRFHRPHFDALEGLSLHGLSLSRWAQDELGLVLDHAVQSFRVAFPGAALGELLSCHANTPLLRVERELHFRGAGPLVHGVLHCRTDELSFSQSLQGDCA